ncbi:hypothetical protein LAZ67_6000424 [Cordylochernes scorpioides]|uniref:Reverse transcriptase RNase H-like domain-containing protein n=1 Tax=Cordylochernes scorpioides TaxID=51811 RepID=A0ABY6KJ80_9ARAC|nr:hypothetical protein LAZ67_6000424 [Cordylochernes scorpioides]
MDNIKMGMKIPKLEGLINWPEYKKNIKLLLTINKVIGVVDGTYRKPIKQETNEEKEAYVKWESEDAISQLLFTTSVIPDVSQLIIPCSSAKDMWDKLLSVYEQSSGQRLDMLYNQFFNFKKDPTDDISKHISKLESLWNDMQNELTKQENLKLPESMLMCRIINTLPDEYFDFKSVWESVSVGARFCNHTPTEGPFPRTAAATHHQQEPHKPINLPPYPCKICASHQLPNQIHFHRDCPLKNNTHPKRINPDASSLGVAGVLKQPDEQGILHPIGYFSRKLHPYEQNYTASEIETLAIINSVQRFHTYLHNIHFTLHTDHLPLKWIKNVKNPQETNAKVERLNSTIINRLRCEYNANLKIPWTKYIPKITESYNETVHTTTGFTPKFLYYGIQPQYIEHDTVTHTPIEKARKLAIERTIKSHEHSKQLYDIKHPEPIFKEGDQRNYYLWSTENKRLRTFNNGDLVLVERMHETKGRHKFEPRYGGPYEVLRRAGDTVYLLKNLETGNLDKYHIDRLKQYHIPIRIFPTEEEESSDGNSSQGSSDEDHWIHLTGPAYLPNRSVNVVVPQGVTTRANSEVMRRGEVDRKEGSNESSTPRGKDGVERIYHKEGLLLKAKEESGRVVYIPMNDNLTQRLRLLEIRIQQRDECSTSSSTALMANAYENKQNMKGKVTKSNENFQKTRETREYYFCHRKGHLAKD